MRKKRAQVTIDTAVILAGGKGLRLLPITVDKPKTMVAVLHKPIIEWILLWLKKNKIKKLVVSVDYKKEVLIKHLGDGKDFGVRITYNDHSGAKETGDAFRSVLENTKLPKYFFAMNSDQITDLSLRDLAARHMEYKPIATIVTCPTRHPYGVVEVGPGHSIMKFVEKPILRDILMNAGIYVFDRDILEYLPKRGSIEKTTFKKLAKKGNLKSYTHHGLFTTVNDQNDLKSVEKILQKHNGNLI